jgi:integrase
MIDFAMLDKNKLDFAPSLNLKALGCKMVRPRHQKGWLKQERGQWIAHWYAYVRLQDGTEKRRRRKRVIGSAPKMKRWQALEKLAALVAGDPSTLSARPDPRITLDRFYEERFAPLAEGRWRNSTQKSQPYVIKKHILPRFGNVTLDRITRFDVQTWLDTLGKEDFSREQLTKIRNLFHVICDEAVKQDYLERNPCNGVKVNSGRPKCKRFLTLEEIARLDQNLPHRERIVFRCLVLLGLRPGELFARRWKDWTGDRLTIDSAVYRGEIGEPKTEKSRGFVWVPKMIQQDLGLYRLSVKRAEPEDFIFTGPKGSPMDSHNYLRRILKPACAVLGVPDVTHQALRRTCSTYLLPAGTVKDAQSHLRHASARTTLEFYSQEVPESVRQAVEKMSEMLFTKVSDGNGRIN